MKKISKKKILKHRVVNQCACIAKAFFASPKSLFDRIPELQPLQMKTVAVFGLGCLGAPSVLEFARSGIGFIRIVDYDIVDPATTVRWPFGFAAAGKKKVSVLSDFINKNYPYIQCETHDFKVGQLRDISSGNTPDQEVIDEILRDVDLVYDCTADLGVQHFLTDYVRNRRISYIGLAGTLGGWGGKIFRIRPWLKTGCWNCYRIACDEKSIPEPTSAPDQKGTVQPVGCADPTFTGAGFDMLQIALTGTRMAVSTLCEGTEGAYPTINWDFMHVSLRNDEGLIIPPKYEPYNIKPNPDCPNCNGRP